MLFSPNAFLAALASNGAAPDYLPHGRCVRHPDAATTMPVEPETATAAPAELPLPGWRPRNMHEWLT